VKSGKAIKPKKDCCKSDPRCSRCPVVLRRLEAQGLMERSKKRYLASTKIKKKQLKAARAR
jgi:hypothetical protein